MKRTTKPPEGMAGTSGGRVTDEGRKTFTLKNGAEIGGILGRETWRILQVLADSHPAKFASLLAIAEGRGEEIPAAHRDFLRQELFLRGDTGEIVDHIKNVLLSAVQRTAEGLVLVNPFRVPTDEVGRRLEQADADVMEGYRRLLRKEDPGPDEEGRPPGRG
jgi:hypothetical protein